MSAWSKVGTWLKENAGESVALVGSLLTGNVPGAVAAGVAMVSSATGSTEPNEILQRLQTDPSTMLRLKEIALEDSKSIRNHIETMQRLELEGQQNQLLDQQNAHQVQQKTIQNGDNSEDPYVAQTRPKIVRWYALAAIAYVFVFELFETFGKGNGADWEILVALLTLVGSYFGFRTADAFSPHKGPKMGLLANVVKR